MNQRERLEQIRKKHEEERRRKRIFLNRVIFGIAAAILLLLIILGVKGCVSAVSRGIETRKQAKAAREAEIALAQMTTPPGPAYTIDPHIISQNYYEGSAFIGNSFIDDLFMCNFLKDADYFAKTGLSVTDAMTTSTEQGMVPIIDELNEGKEYKKIFMMFGENELGWPEGSFIEHYEELIDKAVKYQPDAKIYLLSITPITKKESDKDIDSTNNEQIVIYNEYIKELAVRKGAVYADIFKAVVGPDGALPDDAASDGVHFGKDYYEKCLLYIQNNYPDNQ